MTKTILILAIAVAFVAGSVLTVAVVNAEDGLTTLQKKCAQEPKDQLKIKPDCELLNLINAIPAEQPISLGHEFNRGSAFSCPLSAGTNVFVEGSPVILSDGTVKVPSGEDRSGAVGFTTLNSQFGSLPAGVWHDIEGFYAIQANPEGCQFPTQKAFSDEIITACAIAGNGDMYCVDAGIQNGIFTGFQWKFKGSALS